MIGPRPHRLGMTSEHAMKELRRCAGSQFDPHVVEVFCSVVVDAPLEDTVGAIRS
jgi:HD-GYP domain-containing protein (c-di-GMP phosphodiesterase class II)